MRVTPTPWRAVWRMGLIGQRDHIGSATILGINAFVRGQFQCGYFDLPSDLNVTAEGQRPPLLQVPPAYAAYHQFADVAIASVEGEPLPLVVTDGAKNFALAIAHDSVVMPECCPVHRHLGFTGHGSTGETGM